MEKSTQDTTQHTWAYLGEGQGQLKTWTDEKCKRQLYRAIPNRHKRYFQEHKPNSFSSVGFSACLFKISGREKLDELLLVHAREILMSGWR